MPKSLSSAPAHRHIAHGARRVDFFVSTFLLTRCARAAHVRRKRGHRRKHKRSRAKSRHKKYCRERAKRLGTNVRRGNPFDMDNRPTVCLRCDHNHTVAVSGFRTAARAFARPRA